MSLPSKKFCILLLLGTLIFGIIIQLFMSDNLLYVRQYTLSSSKLNDTLTIVQISDLHEEEFGARNEELFNEIASLTPDIIAITGDITDKLDGSVDKEYVQNVSAWANALAPGAAFFVTGNHELRSEETVKTNMALNGVTVLDGNIVTIGAGGNTISVGGIDDATLTGGVVSPIDFSHSAGYSVLLAHNPEPFSDEYPGTGADLVLSGHTHGGQVRLPLGSAIFTQEGFFPKYSDGVYTDDNMTMVVSAGLGTSILPFRLWVRPEITLIKIEPLQSDELEINL